MFFVSLVELYSTAQSETMSRFCVGSVPAEALLLSPYLWDETRATPSESTILVLASVSFIPEAR